MDTLASCLVHLELLGLRWVITDLPLLVLFLFVAWGRVTAAVSGTPAAHFATVNFHTVMALFVLDLIVLQSQQINNIGAHYDFRMVLLLAKTRQRDICF